MDGERHDMTFKSLFNYCLYLPYISFIFPLYFPYACMMACMITVQLYCVSLERESLCRVCVREIESVCEREEEAEKE